MIVLLPFKKTLVLTFLLAAILFAHAAEPTVSASNVAFNSQYIDGGQFQLTFTAGNGTGRLIVVKEGSDIGGRPADGTVYATNTTTPSDARFGLTGTEIAPGEWAVYAGSVTTITVTGVKPGTTYYVAIFEYNGTYATPATIDYSPLTPSGQKVTTRSAPTIASTITGFSLVNGNSLRVNYTMGNGTGRIVAARKGTTLAATPVDLVSYTGGSGFMSTTNSSYYLDAETYVVLKSNKSGPGSADYANVTGLEPNTTYTFAVFEYNGSIWANTPVYLRPGSVQTLTTTAGPTLAANSVGFSAVDGDRMTVSCRAGDGKRRLIIARKEAAVTSAPVNGVHYTANAQFGAGTEMGTGEYVVFDGVSSSVTVTGLETFTTYYFAVYEYDQDGSGYTYYLTSVAPGQGSHSTVLPPTANTVLGVAALSGSSVQLKYNYPSSGYGAYRMLVMKEGGPVDFEPQDLKVYGGASSTFGSGAQVVPGTYVIIGQSNGGAPTVTGLTPGHTYYATVFDMNGQFAPMYLRPGSSVVINVPNEPTAAASGARFTSVEGNKLSFSWTNGDGGRRIVVARKGTAVTSTPADGTTYTASTQWGSGSELAAGSGEYVLYDGTGSTVNVTGLEKGTTYHFAVFEYNSGATGPDYLAAAGKWLAAAQTTLSAPTVQVSNLAATNIQATQATITFTVGNGSSRLFLLREGTPVDAEPTEYISYATNNNYGTAITQVGSGNYAVSSGVAIFTVQNLKAATRYYLTAFEFNGNSGPVYLRPGAAAYSFVTTAAGVAAPTQAASAPLFENIDGNKFTFKWTNGDGAGRLVIARKEAPVTFTPVNGTAYTDNAAMGSGSDLGDGQFVVYKGSASNVALTALEPSVTYHFAVYEYNGTGSGTVYGASALVASQSTVTPPATVSTALAMMSGSNTLQLSWTAGSGTGRLVVMREGSPVSSTPAVLTAYSASTSFQNGAQLAAGEYAVYAGSGSSVTVQGLSGGKTYYVSIFEYNGIQAPVYNTSDVLIGNIALSTLPLEWLSFRAEAKEPGVVLHWTTAQESRTAYFEVQRSTDGKTFTSLGRVAANGYSEAARSYSFTDNAADAGLQFYRLKQVDSDGPFTYSKTVQVKVVRPAKVRILLNPVRDYLRLQGDGCLPGGTLVIVDAAGRVIYRAVITASLPQVAVSHLAPGTYYVSIYDKKGEKLVTLPFVH